MSGLNAAKMMHAMLSNDGALVCWSGAGVASASLSSKHGNCFSCVTVTMQRNMHKLCARKSLFCYHCCRYYCCWYHCCCNLVSSTIDYDTHRESCSARCCGAVPNCMHEIGLAVVLNDNGDCRIHVNKRKNATF